MLILMGKNGPIRLVSDARPSAPPIEKTPPPEREARYACIRERVDELCGVERAPLLEP